MYDIFPFRWMEISELGLEIRKQGRDEDALRQLLGMLIPVIYYDPITGLFDSAEG